MLYKKAVLKKYLQENTSVVGINNVAGIEANVLFEEHLQTATAVYPLFLIQKTTQCSLILTL